MQYSVSKRNYLFICVAPFFPHMSAKQKKNKTVEEDEETLGLGDDSGAVSVESVTALVKEASQFLSRLVL